MKAPSILLLIIGAASAAAFLPGGVHGQDRRASRPQLSAGVPSGGMLGILQHGDWQCALPGDAGGDAFVDVPSEAFRIGTASSYVSPAGTGIYLLRGDQVLFTRGPKKDERFVVIGENSLRKLNRDGTPTKMICTRVGNGGQAGAVG